MLSHKCFVDLTTLGMIKNFAKPKKWIFSDADNNICFLGYNKNQLNYISFCLNFLTYYVIFATIFEENNLVKAMQLSNKVM